MTFRDWSVQNHGDSLEPLDDVMKALTSRYGPVNPISTYLGTVNGHWVGLPTSTGTNYKGPVGRISVLRDKAGIDVTAMYPTRPEQTKLADEWTYDAHLKAAEACHKAGMTFGIGLGTTVEDAAAFVATSRGAYLNKVVSRFPVPTRCPYLSTVRLVCASYSPSRLPYLSRKICFEPVV